MPSRRTRPQRAGEPVPWRRSGCQPPVAMLCRDTSSPPISARRPSLLCDTPGTPPKDCTGSALATVLGDPRLRVLVMESGSGGPSLHGQRTSRKDDIVSQTINIVCLVALALCAATFIGVATWDARARRKSKSAARKRRLRGKQAGLGRNQRPRPWSRPGLGLPGRDGPSGGAAPRLDASPSICRVERVMSTEEDRRASSASGSMRATGNRVRRPVVVSDSAGRNGGRFNGHGRGPVRRQPNPSTGDRRPGQLLRNRRGPGPPPGLGLRRRAWPRRWPRRQPVRRRHRR